MIQVRERLLARSNFERQRSSLHARIPQGVVAARSAADS
jgi:hypothetical protein